MRPDDFDFICTMLRERSGLILNQDKGYLLESRLTPVAQRNGLAGLDALIEKLRGGGDEALNVEVTEAMTTNESFFFRDEHVFTGFRDSILPKIMEARASKRQIRIWCAAASSGQEPYTIAMIMKEAGAKLDGWNCEIIGTDLSKDILDRANDGLYSQFEVQRGLPVQLLVKYFEKEDQSWRISPEIKSMVRYREFNLLEDMSMLGAFDIVFCRNVLIYFDQGTKGEILGRIASLMPADGTLILGGAETVVGISDRFIPDPNQRGVYCISGAAQGAPGPTYRAKPAGTVASVAGVAPASKPVTAAALTTASTPPPRAPATPAAGAPAPAAPAPRPAAASAAAAPAAGTVPAPARPANPATAALAASVSPPPTAVRDPIKPAAASPAAPAGLAGAKPSLTPPASTAPPLAIPPKPATTPAAKPNSAAPAKPGVESANNAGTANPHPLRAEN